MEILPYQYGATLPISVVYGIMAGNIPKSNEIQNHQEDEFLKLQKHI